jgi:hypothetical protein
MLHAFPIHATAAVGERAAWANVGALVTAGAGAALGHPLERW